MSGQATVEFAMAALFGLLPMIFGTIEVGRGVWYYNQLSQLSREGARWVIVTTAHNTYQNYGNTPGTYNLGTCGCPDTAVGHMAALEAGIPANSVTVVIQQLNGAPSAKYSYGNEVRVAVTYPYQPVVTSLLNIPATINLEAETTMRMQ